MGLFSGGSKGIDKSKSTQNITTTDNSNVAAGGEGSVALRAEQGSSVQILDAGAIEQAFRFASESLGLSERAVTQAQETFDAALDQTLNTSEQERTAGATRTVWIAGAALVAVVGLAYVLRN